MPHQCTQCGKVYPDAAEELLKGCNCGSRFFYYIKQEKLDELEREKVKQIITELNKADKKQIEQDIRELTGMDEEPEKPVILDLESVRVIKPGKFEIDIINLFSHKRPLIYKLEEGKYVLDLDSSLKVSRAEVDKKIRDPTGFLEKREKSSDMMQDKEDENEEDEEESEDEEDEEESEDEEEESEKKDIKNKKSNTPQNKGDEVQASESEGSKSLEVTGKEKSEAVEKRRKE